MIMSTQNQHSYPTFPFAKMPKFLFTEERYSLLSNEAKILYSLLLDRHGLSKKNADSFSDENGVYVVFTRENMAAALQCSRQKAGRVVSELLLCGLIKERRMGLNHPNRIYVQPLSPPQTTEDIGCYTEEHPNVMLPHPLDGMETDSNETDNNNTDIYTDNTVAASKQSSSSINLAAKNESDTTDKEHITNAATIKNKQRKKITKQSYLDILEKVKRQIDFDDFFAHENERTLSLVSALMQSMVDVYISSAASIRVNHQNIGSDLVKWRYSQIDRACIEYVLECLEENATDIKNIRSYIRTALYNAPETINLYYGQAVSGSWQGKIARE